MTTKQLLCPVCKAELADPTDVDDGDEISCDRCEHYFVVRDVRSFKTLEFPSDPGEEDGDPQMRL